MWTATVRILVTSDGKTFRIRAPATRGWAFGLVVRCTGRSWKLWLLVCKSLNIPMLGQLFTVDRWIHICQSLMFSVTCRAGKSFLIDKVDIGFYHSFDVLTLVCPGPDRKNSTHINTDIEYVKVLLHFALLMRLCLDQDYDITSAQVLKTIWTFRDKKWHEYHGYWIWIGILSCGSVYDVGGIVIE